MNANPFATLIFILVFGSALGIAYSSASPYTNAISLFISSFGLIPGLIAAYSIKIEPSTLG